MEFRIADTFADSLDKLTGAEQKAVKTTAFELQMDPARPGFRYHRLDRARDQNFWSVRVSADLRLIVHRAQNSLLLCYVAHHDRAYRWAQRRRLETHPKTGALQLVELRETVKEIVVPVYVEEKRETPARRRPFVNMTGEELLAYGVPTEWLQDVRNADEDALLELADHLPSEAAEALLELATGGTPPLPRRGGPDDDPFEHPDARRRFRVMRDVEELRRALDAPWAKWAVFLHPAQRALVARDYSGPARVSGSAGTGKTIVALHRAVHLARAHPNARVLLTTFSETLARALRAKLATLLGSRPNLGEQIEVYAINALAERLYRLNLGRFELASRERIGQLLDEAAAAARVACAPARTERDRVSSAFLLAEWERVVDAWQLETWEAYRDVPRLGRRRSLPQDQRRALWSIFHATRAALEQARLITRPQMFGALASRFARAQRAPFDFVIIDECQDFGVPHLRFLRALGGDKPNGLFFTGDLGQRIFQQPFSWQALGIEIRGRARTLKVNYRTSHQIRRRADLLLEPEIADVDGNAETRAGTISAFNGTEPEIVVCDSADDEIETVAAWLTKMTDSGLPADEISVFVRAAAQIGRAEAAVQRAGLSFARLDEAAPTRPGRVAVSAMHQAKGLEFRAVAVMACDDEVSPLQARIESVTDDADLEEVYNTERHLLYVACTRARDELLVSGVRPASEFLDDLGLR